MATVVQTPIIQSRQRDTSGLRQGIGAITSAIDQRRKQKALAEAAEEHLSGDVRDTGKFMAAAIEGGADPRAVVALANSIQTGQIARGGQSVALSGQRSRARTAQAGQAVTTAGQASTAATAEAGQKNRAKIAGDQLTQLAGQHDRRMTLLKAELTEKKRAGKISEEQLKRKLDIAEKSGTNQMAADLAEDMRVARRSKLDREERGRIADAGQAAATQRTRIGTESAEGIAAAQRGSATALATAGRLSAEQIAAANRAVPERALAEKKRQFGLTQPLAERGVRSGEITAAAAAQNASTAKLKADAGPTGKDVRSANAQLNAWGLEINAENRQIATYYIDNLPEVKRQVAVMFTKSGPDGLQFVIDSFGVASGALVKNAVTELAEAKLTGRIPPARAVREARDEIMPLKDISVLFWTRTLPIDAKAVSTELQALGVDKVNADRSARAANKVGLLQAIIREAKVEAAAPGRAKQLQKEIEERQKKIDELNEGLE